MREQMPRSATVLLSVSPVRGFSSEAGAGARTASASAAAASMLSDLRGRGAGASSQRPTPREPLGRVSTRFSAAPPCCGLNRNRLADGLPDLDLTPSVDNLSGPALAGGYVNDSFEGDRVRRSSVQAWMAKTGQIAEDVLA